MDREGEGQIGRIKSFFRLVGRAIWNSKPVAAAFLALGIGIGFFLDSYFGLPEGWSFKREVLVGDVINLFNGVVILLLFALYLTKAVNADIHFKGLISTMCDVALENLKESKRIFDQLRSSAADAAKYPDEISWAEAFGTLKQKDRELSNALDDVLTVWGLAGFKAEDGDDMIARYTLYREFLIDDAIHSRDFSNAGDHVDNYYSQLKRLIREFQTKAVFR